MFYKKENGGFTRRDGAWYSDLDESKGDGHWEIRATGSVRLSSHGLRSGDGRSFVFSSLFFFFFFFFYFLLLRPH
jgi:hypothetical protein